MNSTDRHRDRQCESRPRTLTRRAWLQNAALVTAAAGFPRAIRAAAGQDISPVMDKLSHYMADARNQVLPDKVVEEAKHHILDTIAAMVSGAELPPGRMAIQFARSYGGEKVATVVASNILCGPIEAAFANGELAPVSLLIPTKPMMTSPPEEPIPGARWCPRPWLPANNSSSLEPTSCGL